MLLLLLLLLMLVAILILLLIVCDIFVETFFVNFEIPLMLIAIDDIDIELGAVIELEEVVL